MAGRSPGFSYPLAPEGTSYIPFNASLSLKREDDVGKRRNNGGFGP